MARRVVRCSLQLVVEVLPMLLARADEVIE
jgi:hypothetical protein